MQGSSNLQNDTLSQAPTTSHSVEGGNGHSDEGSSFYNKGINKSLSINNDYGSNKQPKLLNPQQKRRISEFLDRFQGKVSQISKDGHLGVVARTSKPIEKVNMDYHN